MTVKKGNAPRSPSVQVTAQLWQLVQTNVKRSTAKHKTKQSRDASERARSGLVMMKTQCGLCCERPFRHPDFVDLAIG